MQEYIISGHLVAEEEDGRPERSPIEDGSDRTVTASEEMNSKKV